MTDRTFVELGSLMRDRGSSLDPSKFPTEIFELYSIPSFDAGAPELRAGSQIGSSKQTVEPGDVLLSRIVPHIRRSWIVGNRNGRRQIASGEWIVFRSRDFISAYLRHLLTTDFFHARFMQTVAGVGGSLLRARPQQVAMIKIPLPSKAEQERIATILDKADAIRSKRRRALADIDTLLRAAYQTIVSVKHPQFSEWKLWAFEKLAADHPGAMRTGPFGSDLRHSEFVDKGIAVLGIDNAVKNCFAWDARRFITPQKYELLRRYRAFPGDVIITIMGTTGRSAVVPADVPEAITTKHLASITLNRELALPEFIAFAIHSDPRIVHQIMRANKGAIMDGLNLGIIKKLQIALPPMSDQRRFTHVYQRLNAQKSRLQMPDASGDDLFNSISQRAFRGEL